MVHCSSTSSDTQVLVIATLLFNQQVITIVWFAFIVYMYLFDVDVVAIIIVAFLIII